MRLRRIYALEENNFFIEDIFGYVAYTKKVATLGHSMKLPPCSTYYFPAASNFRIPLECLGIFFFLYDVCTIMYTLY